MNPTTKTVLFLCTGNYYRSRYAEILFNARASTINLGWMAVSRGLALERGANNLGPMARSAIAALENLGIQPNAECARFPLQVTFEDLKSADLVIALKQEEHWPLLQDRYPGWAERVEYWHIDDAPGILFLVEQKVKDLVDQLSVNGQR
jgi:protein-tyrosine phosphatase